MTSATLDGVQLAAQWRLLSLGFTSPSPDTVAEVETLAEGLVEAGSAPEVSDVLAAAREADVGGLATQFAALFRGNVLVPPYEASYELDPIRQSRQIADIAGFYRAFGAEAHGPAAERPDYVGCELEFLSFLELRRLAAAEEGDTDAATLVDEIIATFLRDHAGRWLPTFVAEVEGAAARAPFYRTLAALGRRTVADELARRGVEPSPLTRRSTRSSVERDSFECAS
jgi:TorA maturation chaperone TorD